MHARIDFRFVTWALWVWPLLILASRSTYVSRPKLLPLAAGAVRRKSIRKCKQLTGKMWQRSVSSVSILLVLIVLSLTGEGIMKDNTNWPND